MNKEQEPLLLRTADHYKFTFSTERQLAGRPSCCRVLTYLVLISATIALPVLLLLNKFNVLNV